MGSAIAINVNNNFPVDTTNNRFIVTVDDVKGEVVIPTNANYTLDGFMAELQSRINLLANDTGSTVSGVKVEYDRQNNAFKFTSGTASSNSFIKVSGSATWGLTTGDAGRGVTSSWIKPTQFTDYSSGLGVKKYINDRGEETSSADGYTTLPEWSPVYLDKGELTFDTAGKLVSPRTGAQLDTVFLPDGKGSLRINIDYSKSTQYSSPFAVLSQSQDGAPEGDLVVPGSVLIPAGQTLASFEFSVKDDTLVNLRRSAQVEASLPGTQSSTAFLAVHDNEPLGIRLEIPPDRKSTRLNSSHVALSRMPSSA